MVDGVLGDRQIPHVVEAGHALPLQRGDRNKGECSTWNIQPFFIEPSFSFHHYIF